MGEEQLLLEQDVNGDNDADQDIQDPGGQVHGSLQQLGNHSGELGSQVRHQIFRSGEDLVDRCGGKAFQIVLVDQLYRQIPECLEPAGNLIGQSGKA